MPFDISVQVCTSSHWPIAQNTSRADNAILPDSFQKAVKSFESFYFHRHTGRKLNWRADMGSVDVKVQFRARKHELNVSTHAMIVLSLFENRSTDDWLPLDVCDFNAY